MLTKINIRIQQPQQDWNRDFVNIFTSLISSSKNVFKISDKELEIRAGSLLPVTQINFENKSTAVIFKDDSAVVRSLRAEGLSIAINEDISDKPASSLTEFKILQDEIGEYCEVVTRSNEPRYLLTMKQLWDRFQGKIIEVNHTGINFSPASIPLPDYQFLKKHIATQSFLVNYPTGEEWPFIIPSTEEENLNGITDTSIIRHPLFELVYSDYNSIPVIQFDIRPDLAKEEVLRLLPEPYGISFEGLEDSIRTVYVLSDIKDVIIRFDIGLRSTSTNSFYPWMIKEGGRFIK